MTVSTKEEMSSSSVAQNKIIKVTNEEKNVVEKAVLESPS